MRGRVITLMGIDGCGKSTLSRALQAELASRGVPAVARWATLRPVLVKPLIAAAKFLLVRKAPKSVDYDAHMAAKRTGMNKLRFAHGIYFWVMALDYLPQVWWKVGVPRLLGKVVICDRYYQDLALDYAVLVNGDAARMREALKVLARLAPTPDLEYFVAIAPEIALSRKDDVPSIAYLEERDRFYRALADACAARTLRGDAPVDDNCARLLRDLKLNPA